MAYAASGISVRYSSSRRMDRFRARMRLRSYFRLQCFLGNQVHIAMGLGIELYKTRETFTNPRGFVDVAGFGGQQVLPPLRRSYRFVVSETPTCMDVHDTGENRRYP